MHCEIYTTKKTKVSIKDFFSKCAFGIADLVTFTKEILNGKLHFLCSDITTTSSKNIWVKFITYEKNNLFDVFNSTRKYLENTRGPVRVSHLRK